MFAVVALIIFLVFLTVILHMEGLWLIQSWIAVLKVSSHVKLGAVVLLTLALHVIEIACYAAAYVISDRMLNLGDFVSGNSLSIVDYLYYSAETFTALGYGDITVSGDLRLIASFEPLNGLTLMSWSGAFTFLTMQRYWDDRAR